MAFSDNVWWTRKARIQSEKRLLSNAFQSQVLLLWYSFFGVAVSVYYLKFANSSASTSTSADLAGITWVVYSVLLLCLSGFIAGLSFKERAGLIKECYETLNSLYQKAKAQDADIGVLAEEHQQIMGLCENHTDSDYYIALCETYLTHPSPRGDENGLDRWPTKYHWMMVVMNKVKRILMFSLLYLLPIGIFMALELLP
ncbi:hypothetical protein A9Q81_00125 [Gammaproteobacteria bacterium 42_54_T18]|nr:hypothetical protein A9Q81_00125 [Gammaproteobacteria bacterium 42_54_T18]